MRILVIILLLCLQGCGFTPILAKNNSGYKALSEVRVVSVEGQDNLRLKRIIEESFENNSQTLGLYDLKITVSHNISSMGIMTDSQITRYRVKMNLKYTLLDGESRKSINEGDIYLQSSFDSEASEFANFIAERNIADNVLKELAEELKTRLILVISELEADGKNRN